MTDRDEGAGARHVLATNALTTASRETRERAVLLVVALVATVSVIFQLVDEGAALTPDSASFMRAASGILDGNPFDVKRTPGYPVLLAVAGKDTTAAIILQGFLFVFCAVGVGFLTQRATGRWWAGATGALFGLMELPLDYTRTITSELLAMTLLVAVACLAATFTPRRTWPTAAIVALLVFTRPEFLALPAVLLVLVLVAYGDRRARVHAVLAAGAIYALVGLYILGNNAINDYPGFTVVTEINSLGKAMQYGLQDEAPSRYSTLTARIDDHLDRGLEASPYVLAERYPGIRADNWELAGDYGRSVLRAAPLTYAWKSAELAARQKKILVLAALGLILWAAARSPRTRVVGLLSLLCLYDLVMTSLGAYDNYERLYAPIFPLTVVLIVSIAVLDVELVRRVLAARAGGRGRGSTATAPP